MFYPKLRGVMLMCSMAAVLSAMPTESRACQLLDNLFGCGAARTTYRMPYVTAYAPACTSCAPTSCVSCMPQTCCYASQTCCYVPQTCYRTVYRPLLTGSFRPLLVPYTTYRAVYSNPCVTCNPCATCNPCIGGACGTVTYSGTTTSVGSSCPSCVPSATPSSSVPVARPEPATFQQNTTPPIQKTLKPIPKIETQLNSTPAAPSLIDPSSRTTLQPIRQASYNRLVTTGGLALPVENGGWRASRD